MKGKSTFNNKYWPFVSRCLNSEATNHMTLIPKLFNSYVKMTKEQLITIANDGSVPIYKSENITLFRIIYSIKRCVICHYKKIELLNNFLLLLCISGPGHEEYEYNC